ncbi:internal virion protein [Stenotrophomonas phage vB_SmeS_BUCT700]|uniref:Internal virion protein n=1 Tax=Stenotrophomonas phage vB_SmeS_BUCT700 TaxID=2924895 RepID=A0AAE9GBA9_9CAUD|nr:internal virion protein [Stenotrophomonas phage vB_SmeS_BUCT700]UNY50272.1 internal virion protein [Stenotrophomonas phage vB_SmeS_BUCT703]
MSLGTILQAPNIHRVAVANWEKETKTRAANNDLKRAQGNLSTWSRSLGNKKRVQAAEEEYNRQMEGLSHELRQMGKQSATAYLSASEQQGALMALAAFSGVGGSSVEAMENLVSLQDATTQEELQQAMDNMNYFGKENAATVMGNAYESQDFSQTQLDLDFTKSLRPVAMKRRLGKLIGVAVASYFGGPQAGEMVADVAVGEWKAHNGDFQGAMGAYGSAIQNGMQAWKDTSERGGAWGKDVMEGLRKANVTNKTTNVKVSSASEGKKKSWFKRS